mgnify:CR=1 FL=1
MGICTTSRNISSHFDLYEAPSYENDILPPIKPVVFTEVDSNLNGIPPITLDTVASDPVESAIQSGKSLLLFLLIFL